MIRVDWLKVKGGQEKVQERELPSPLSIIIPINHLSTLTCINTINTPLLKPETNSSDHPYFNPNSTLRCRLFVIVVTHSNNQLIEEAFPVQEDTGDFTSLGHLSR